MLESKQKGIVTELQCITAFNQLGYHVSIPYGENSRYDFIADINNKLIRVQVKASSPKQGTSGAISFSCRSSRSNANGVVNRRYTKDEVDYFATFYDNICYLVPIEECSAEKTLRFEHPKNGQVQGVSFAKDYELSLQIQKIIER